MMITPNDTFIEFEKVSFCFSLCLYLWTIIWLYKWLQLISILLLSFPALQQFTRSFFTWYAIREWDQGDFIWTFLFYFFIWHLFFQIVEAQLQIIILAVPIKVYLAWHYVLRSKDTLFMLYSFHHDFLLLVPHTMKKLLLLKAMFFWLAFVGRLCKDYFVLHGYNSKLL